MFKKTKMDKFNQAYLRIINECRRNAKKSVIKQGIFSQPEDPAYDKIMNTLQKNHLVANGEDAYDKAIEIFSAYQQDEDNRDALISALDKFQDEWQEFFKTAEDVYDSNPINPQDDGDNVDFMMWAATKIFKEMTDEQIISLAKKYEVL